MKPNLTNGNAEFKLSYEFKAPKKLVFNAFADAKALGEWWGPAGFKNSVLSLDFRPGGIFHFKMEKEGVTNYGRFIFGKIQPHDVLEFTNAFADEKANVVKAPFDIEIPKEIFYRLEFKEQGGKTTIHMTGQPVNASQTESEAFTSIADSMRQGFGASFDELAAYLASAN